MDAPSFSPGIPNADLDNQRNVSRMFLSDWSAAQFVLPEKAACAARFDILHFGR
jgi:hypothetical protein